jgi:hypothetical protein
MIISMTLGVSYFRESEKKDDMHACSDDDSARLCTSFEFEMVSSSLRKGLDRGG